jgi:hypothetical protein
MVRETRDPYLLHDTTAALQDALVENARLRAVIMAFPYLVRDAIKAGQIVAKES